MDLKTVPTPADISVRLKKDDGISKDVNPINYQSIVHSNSARHCSGSGSSVKIQIKAKLSTFDSCKTYSTVSEGNSRFSTKVSIVTRWSIDRRFRC